VTVRKSSRGRTFSGRFIEPMHARLVNTLPDGDDWLYEVKFDGYRALAVKNGDSVRLLSRRNKDLTADYPAVRSAVVRIRAEEAILDGEIVAVGEHGRPSFQALQYRTAHQASIAYYAFDLLQVNGADIMGRPLEERKARLREVVAGSGVLLSDALPGDADSVTEAVRRLGLEGVVAKRKASLYEPGRRSGAWVKLKLDKQQEFVVGGYRPGYGTLDTLLVGYYEGADLIFASKVRAGFTPHLRADVVRRFDGLHAQRCPFVNLPSSHTSHWGWGVTAEQMSEMRWLKPRLVAQVRFVEWTADGHLRHAAFIGLRDDKNPKDVRRE
jgi:bifunctional non-homologous end joining protein LigD